MKKIMGIVICLTAVLGFSTTSYAFNYVHEDDFNTDTIKEYTVSAKNGSSATITEDADGNGVLEIIGADSNVSLVEKKITPLDNIAVFDMDFQRLSTAGGSVRVLQIFDADRKNRPFLLNASNRGMSVRIGDGTTMLSVPEYENGEKVSIRTVLDFTDKTFDLYINGVLYCEDKAFFQSAAENAGIIQMQIDGGTGTGQCHFDNLAFYGINNGELDLNILQAENDMYSYSTGTETGNYSLTRYLMYEESLLDIRNRSKEALSDEEIAALCEELQTAKNDFEKGRIYSQDDIESGEIDILANDIVFEADKETVFTSEEGIIEYALNAVVFDNFMQEYDGQVQWEMECEESIVLDNNMLIIPSGTQGTVKLKASVDGIFRYFTLYLRDYSRVAVSEITAGDGKICVKGNIVRNSEDTVEIQIAFNDYSTINTIEENEDGSFETMFIVDEEMLTTEVTLTVVGEYVHPLEEKFIYFSSDAATVALSRIENGTDEEISETLKLFSKYLNVDSKVFEENKKAYTDMVKAGIPYDGADGLNERLLDINLIIKINSSVRSDIEEIITSGMDVLKENGFDTALYSKLSKKNKTKFLAKAADVEGDELDEICKDLNEIMKECNKTESVSTGGGGGGGGGGGSKKTSSVSVAPSYTVTPVLTNPPAQSNTDTQTKPSDTAVIEYADENEAQWAKDAIYYLSGLGIISGYENKIRPNDPVTRGEMAKMLVEAFDIASDTETVYGNEWWYEYAVRGIKSGIMKGYDDGDFHGNDLLTRQDMAVLLSRVIEYKAISVYEKAEEKEFNDRNEISEYALKAITDLQKYGILSGMGENMFSPKSYVTRAQAITAMYNVLTVKAE